MNTPLLIHLIYLRSGLVLLSKKDYADWRAIQAAYSDYMTSLGPWTAADISEFFRQDFGNEADWPLSPAEIEAFAASDDEVYFSSKGR
jgi:hypothetical protein